jgi:hypothetical protein
MVPTHERTPLLELCLRRQGLALGRLQPWHQRRRAGEGQHSRITGCCNRRGADKPGNLGAGYLSRPAPFLLRQASQECGSASVGARELAPVSANLAGTVHKVNFQDPVPLTSRRVCSPHPTIVVWIDIKRDFVARDLFVRKHANQMSCPMVKVRRASRPEDGLKGRDPSLQSR